MIGLFWGYSVSVQAEELPYKNPNLPIEERVNDLLKRMTVEEKFWQIYMMPGDLDAGKERFKDGIFGFQVSTVGADDPQMRQMLQYNPKLTAAETVKKVNQIQRYFVEETHLVPFKACFQEGGSQSVMTAYNMLDGTPCTANSWLTIDKLRKEWGFDGFTIADADAVGIIHKLHHTLLIVI